MLENGQRLCQATGADTEVVTLFAIFHDARRLQALAAEKASRYTSSRRPVRLAYRQPQPPKSRVLKREAAIKRLPGFQKLALLARTR